MLLDPKWEVDLKTKLEPWRQLLLDGADRIEQEGWWCGSGGIGYCVITSLALDAAPGIKEKAWKCFGAYIGGGPHVTSIIRWNDTVGRTKDQVLFAMRDCARNG